MKIMLIPAKKTRKINCTSKIHVDTWVTVTFLVNLMFRRRNKFDGPIYEGGDAGSIYRGAYFQDVNWVTYLKVYIRVRTYRRAYIRGRINGILRYCYRLSSFKKKFFLEKSIIAGLSVLSIAWRGTFSLSEWLNCRSRFCERGRGG